MSPKFFKNQFQFRQWLEKYHDKKTELLVGFYKVDSGKPSMSWSESVDQALCFGWMDGIRKSIDSESYCIRFTPRRTSSIWSAINIKKIENLTKAGLMKPAGIKAFSFRKEEKSNVYSHESQSSELSITYTNQFKQHKQAWEFFCKQAPSYQKVICHWIMSAKQEKTKQTRLEKVISASTQQKRLE
jgi:uncharacterized protein YdeI (YjbR/CyaY-like superfamily)